MKIFQPIKETIRDQNSEVYALYELAYTAVDFLAAGLFVVGSILLFNEATTYAATWMFLIGSICFGLKPTIRLMRRVQMFRNGREKELAEWASRKMPPHRESQS